LADDAGKERRVVSARWFAGRSNVSEAGRTAGELREPTGLKEGGFDIGFTAAPEIVPNAVKAIRTLNGARQGICNCCGL
jgi:hypothetical protein